MEGIKPIVKRGGTKKDWIHTSFVEGRCIYCDQAILTTNTTVKKNHLLNPRACSFLQSSDARSNPDAEIVRRLAGSSEHGTQRATKRASIDMGNVISEEASHNMQHWSSSDVVHSVNHAESLPSHHPSIEGSRDDKTEGYGSVCKKKHHSRNNIERLQEAEAILAELKQKQKSLEQDNALMRAKEEIYTRGTYAADDVLRLIESHRIGMCRQTLLLNHAERQRQDSFDTIPPPWEWTSPWLHRLATLDVNAVRYIIMTGVKSAKGIIRSMTQVCQRQGIVGDPQAVGSSSQGPDGMSQILGQRLSSQLNLQKEQSQLANHSAKAWALFFYLVSTNFMTVLGNTGVFFNTGAGIHDSPGEQWYMNHARQLLPLLESEPRALDGIRSGLLVYNNRMEKIRLKRAELKQRLSIQLTRPTQPLRTSCTGQSMHPSALRSRAWSVPPSPPASPEFQRNERAVQGEVWRQMMGMASERALPRIHSEPLPPLLNAESVRFNDVPDDLQLGADSISLRYDDMQLMRLLLSDDDEQDEGQAAAMITQVEEIDGEICRDDEPGLGQGNQRRLESGGGHLPLPATSLSWTPPPLSGSHSSDGARASEVIGVMCTAKGRNYASEVNGVMCTAKGRNDDDDEDGPEFGGSISDDPLLRMHEIQRQLLLSFRQEAAERMLFNSMLQRVLTYEAEVGCYMHPYWPDRPKLMEYVIMFADQRVKTTAATTTT